MDVFDSLPTAPNSGALNNSSTPTASGAGGESSNPLVSIADIKDFISPKLYEELSWAETRSGDDVTQDCIDRAVVLTETLLHLVDQELNLYSKTQQEIVKTLTVYELYIYNGDKAKARIYMDRAERLISNRYGSLKSKREDGVPVGAIRVPGEG